MPVRRPKFRRQIGDPTTTLDSYICTLSSGAMALDVITKGRVQVWGGELVPYCGRSESVIRQRGTTLTNVALAWKHWGETLDIDSGGKWENVLHALETGYWIILQGDYDQFSLDTRCQDSFLGNHAVLIGPEFEGTKVLFADPLCSDFKFAPLVELKKYAEKLGRSSYDQSGIPWNGQIYYAKIQGETMAAYKSTITQRVVGKVRVKSDAPHAAVQLHDGDYIWLGAGEMKDTYAKITISPRIPGGSPTANRTDGYLVGAEEAILLESDVDFIEDHSLFNAGVDAAANKARTARK